MSLILQRLGLSVGRHRLLVIVAWVVILVCAVLGAKGLGTHYDETFTIPGTSSQQGEDILKSRFPASTGATAQLVFTTPGSISASKPAVENVVARVSQVDGVKTVGDPFAAANSSVSRDGGAAIATVQFEAVHPSASDLAQVKAAAKSTPTVTVLLGGSAYSSSATESKLPEEIGVAIALLILALTFGSLLAAGMPLAISILGVGIVTALVEISTSFGDVSSTAPTLAEMLGLAVGIDYSLFILSRHRAGLAAGLTPRESVGAALGTAGSAVVFAGCTVIVALLGLSVANIPFLTVMGIAGAMAVAVAVLVSLTLLPAIALLFGSRLTPRRGARVPKRPRRLSFGRFWVTAVTRRPVVTIVAVTAALGTMALPLASMTLALPSNESQPTTSEPRQVYDAIGTHFGPGYNGPLILVADIISSPDPTETVKKLAADLRGYAGVAAVTEATSNPSGDTAYLTVVPTTGPTATATATLVGRIRSHAAQLEKKTGVHDLTVTGSTAVQIDVSSRLGAALVPFALVVVGLSFLLLMVVFRSVAVPVKATLGYLLSVCAGLGAVVAVFQFGWFGKAITGGEAGPIVSFLPIIVMGVQFGLAMDYEMFLVSRMRERFSQSGDALGAVRQGFGDAAPVVTAAALIMVGVFSAFIPTGSSTIKPIAFGLAIGVFVDAFLVRMTLVPAVLALLGTRAWWMPRWIDHAVPKVDIEGAAISRLNDFNAISSRLGSLALVARDVIALPQGSPISLLVRTSTAVAITVADATTARALGYVVAARMAPESGNLVVRGLVLPEERSAVQERTTVIDLVSDVSTYSTVEEMFASAAMLATDRHRTRGEFEARARSLLAQLENLSGRSDRPIGPTVSPADLDACERMLVNASIALAAGADVLVVVGIDELRDTAVAREVTQVAAVVASLGKTVLVPLADARRRQSLVSASHPPLSTRLRELEQTS